MDDAYPDIVATPPSDPSDASAEPATATTTQRLCRCPCPSCNCRCPCRDHCICLSKQDDNHTCNNECGSYKVYRNLVVCLDGTSSKQFGRRNTNIVELHNRILKDDPDVSQLAFDISDLETYVPPRFSAAHWPVQYLNNPFSSSFERLVEAAYIWISDHYQPEDRLFLFGLSRGAYQVRALAAMIEKLGLVCVRKNQGHKERCLSGLQKFEETLRGSQEPEGYFSGSQDPETYLNQLQDRLKIPRSELTKKKLKDLQLWQELKNSSKLAIDLYFNGRKQFESDAKAEALAMSFKSVLARPAKVHFVGVWDTASSVGMMKTQPLPLKNTAPPIRACFFRHALASDEPERRVKFLPKFLAGGRSPLTGNKHYEDPLNARKVWFPGRLSD
ncbi:hypothetical protein IW261DRAFT_1503750, partial [Armillaria novae-zelandiae]